MAKAYFGTYLVRQSLLLFLATLLFCVTCSAQKESENETSTSSNGEAANQVVKVLLTYNRNGQTMKAVLTPEVEAAGLPAKAINPKLAETLLIRLAPSNTRGRLLWEGSASIGCSSIWLKKYRYVSLSITYSCDDSRGISEVVLIWKRGKFTASAAYSWRNTRRTQSRYCRKRNTVTSAANY